MEADAELDDCCKVNIPQPTKISACPTCGATGKPVAKLTVSVMAKDPEIYLHPERLPDVKYFLCETKTCPTVYFTANGILFNKEQIKVKVWQKEDSPDIPVCYCFHHTVSSISEELKDTGETDVASRVSAEVKAGNCRCEVTNPQGSCCLGNIVKAIKMARNGLPVDLAKEQRLAPPVSSSLVTT